MVTISPPLLREIAPNNKTGVKLTTLAYEMHTQFSGAGIDTVPELCHFLAQAAHETESFNSLIEDASGHEYEGRRDLGNIFPGDGVKYKGRGIFQVTGRGNYNTLTMRANDVNISFVASPELLEQPKWAVWSAIVYWNDRHLSDIANKEDGELVYSKTLNKSLTPFEYITWRINGGFNGLESRRVFYERAKQLFMK